MPIEDDDDRATFLDPDDFGVTAFWTHDGATSAVDGILSTPSALMSSGVTPDVQVTQARFLCQAAALPAGAAQNDTLLVDGVSYVVRALLPDGTGMTTADLEKE